MKVGLCMIVKNESHIIKEALTSTLSLISTFCIVDTGSTDNTIQVIKDFYSEKGIIGKVHSEPWKNFGYNRSQALTLCDGEMDYALVIDADDLMGFPANAGNDLQTLLTFHKPNSCQLLIKQDGIEYWRAQIFKCNDNWQYVGVLHEYATNKKENNICIKLPTEIFMVSRRLGGRNLTGDKQQRDIAVLEQGIKDEPENERYMFYLAQSYRDAGDFVNAIKFYKQRFKVGKWPEEAWFAAYQVGMCYKRIKNIPKFEYWLQKAHAFRPWRAEPMYHLTEYFRSNGMTHKAYEYCKVGIRITYPKDDVLFVENFPHKGGFLYEKSILDFYVHDNKQIGLRDSTIYLLTNTEHVKNVISNMIFYAQTIKSHKKESLIIPNAFGEDFRPSAISVLHYPFANVRYVNYLPPENNVYKTKDGSCIQTHNAYVNLETNEIITKMIDSSITLPRLETSVKGLEDIRLFTRENETRFIATNFREYNPNIRMLTGKYNTENGEYSDVTLLPSPSNAECEKNWLPIPNTNHIIYNWSPLQIINSDGSHFVKHDVPSIFSLFRGSTIPVVWNKSLLVMVHMVEYTSPRRYYHLLVELQQDTYLPLKISLPFVFESASIEYCISMRMASPNIIECYPSFMDSNLHKYSFHLSSLEWISFNEPANNLVRIPENLNVYWNGHLSKCSPNGSIEQYLKTIDSGLTFLFPHGDGIVSAKVYDEVKQEVPYCFLHENKVQEIESKKLPNTTPLVCALSTRDVTYTNTLLLPLDDDTFEKGLASMLPKTNLAWKDRHQKVFWRGNPGGYERPTMRERVVTLLKHNKDADCKFAFSGRLESYADDFHTKYEIVSRCPFQDFFTYKYLLVIDGISIASNHQWVFGTGSVPILVTHPRNNWWFKKYLIPMENYVPIKYDLSDLEEKLQWLIEHDDKAQKIAENALNLANSIFTPDFQKKYIMDEIGRIKDTYTNKMKVYVVSCNEGRAKRLETAALPLKLNFEIITSPWYTEDEVQRRGKELFDNKTGYPTGVAATLGHLRAMKRFLETNEKLCMIVEDDVRFHKNFHEKIRHIQSYMTQTDCNMFSIGFVNIPRSNETIKINNFEIIENVEISNPWGCQCYMISREYAEKLVTLFSNDNIYEVYKKTFVTDSVFFDTELGCKRSTLVQPIVVEDPNEQTLAGNNNKPDLFGLLNKNDFWF